MGYFFLSCTFFSEGEWFPKTRERFYFLGKRLWVCLEDPAPAAVNGISSDQTLSAALLIGPRWSINKICQLESRITVGKKNLNAELGLTMRYRKSKSS
jgi:hypothetical protein